MDAAGGPEEGRGSAASGTTYPFRKGDVEYALVARFTPEESGAPVFVVAGQSSLTGPAATHFLRREYGRTAREPASAERFCLLVRVPGTVAYAHHRAELGRDVTADAFGTDGDRRGRRRTKAGPHGRPPGARFAPGGTGGPAFVRLRPELADPETEPVLPLYAMPLQNAVLPPGVPTEM
ncbi:hypothetical protein [Streptomyces uncialis]|uniref:hypothetical protein n=1 Tax=Streptomyces uncialis TaxID=1048205 RepID=UPI0033D728BA